MWHGTRVRNVTKWLRTLQCWLRKLTCWHARSTMTPSWTYDSDAYATITADANGWYSLHRKRDSGYDGIRASAVMTCGHYSWQVKAGRNFCCGVASPSAPLDVSAYAPSSAAWCFYGTKGKLYSAGVGEQSFSTKARPVRPDEIVQYDLDMDAGTLSITVSGEPWGAAFDCGTLGPELCVYVCGGQQGTAQLRFVDPTAEAPQIVWDTWDPTKTATCYDIIRSGTCVTHAAPGNPYHFAQGQQVLHRQKFGPSRFYFEARFTGLVGGFGVAARDAPTLRSGGVPPLYNQRSFLLSGYGKLYYGGASVDFA
eukprot:1996279-Prymnesium_polylepis.1